MSTSPSATLPASYAASLVSLMAERGHDVEALLHCAQLDRSQLQGASAQISTLQYARMLGRALEIDGEQGLAYELGLRSQVTRHGFVGFGLISCATLREAAEFGQRYFHARVPGFHSAMSVQGQQVVVELRDTLPLGPQRAHVMDMVVVELCSLFAKVLGLDPAVNGWFSEIWVPHGPPAAYAKYRARLPVFHFHKSAVQIRFPARMLDEPIATADAEGVQLAADRGERELARHAKPAQTLSDQVRERLVCQDGRYPDVAAMAQALIVSERTLKRRLQEDGTSFQALLDAVRLRDSQRLLRQPDCAIQQVAEAVGYTDPANFARAFGKWTGMSPRAWREQQGD